MKLAARLLTCSIALCLFAITVQFQQSKDKKSVKNDELCTSSECVIAAANILETMDVTVDPCDNFYLFACGGYLQSTTIPDANPSWSQFNVLREELSAIINDILTEPIIPEDPEAVNKAKELFLGCVDLDTINSLGVQPLSDLIAQFGGWPMTKSDWESTSFSWSDTTADSKRLLNEDYLVNIYVEMDAKDVFSTIMYIDQTSLGLSRLMLLSPNNFTVNVNAYKQYIRSTAHLLSVETIDDVVLEADIEDTVAFEMQLASIVVPPEDRRDSERLYNKMTVQELQNSYQTSSIDWLQLLNRALSSSNRQLTLDSVIIVREPEYFFDLVNLIDATDSRVVANYLIWRQVMELADQTTTEMRDAAFQYSTVNEGVTEDRSTENKCADLTNNYLGYAVGVKYIEGHFTEQAKEETSIMIEDIRESFKELIDLSEWMDEGTKPVAQEKADFIEPFVAYPDWYEEFEAINDYYSNLGSMDVQNHFSNVLMCREYFSTDQLDDLDLPAERSRWITPPTIVNAMYSPLINAIYFPGGILQSPFYRVNTLQVLNYGGIGQVIGHEISHGFDDMGRQYDRDGNLFQWWSNETIEAFSEEAQCFVDQYGSYVHPQVNVQLNGITALGENIADNGGLRQAYYAYQKYVERNGEEPRLPGLQHYTANQMLFIAQGNIWCSIATDEYLINQIQNNPHAPSMYRVIGPASNMIEFSEAFGCSVESPMNPENKCVLW